MEKTKTKQAIRSTMRKDAGGKKPEKGVHRLSDMDVEEVSAVERGANRKTFTVVKSDEGDDVITRVMEQAVKLEGVEGEDLQVIAKEMIGLIAEAASLDVSIGKVDGPGEDIAAIGATLEKVASTLEAVSKRLDQEAPTIEPEQVETALKAAGVLDLQKTIVTVTSTLAETVKKQASLFRHASELEAIPSDGSAAVDEDSTASDEPVHWDSDMAGSDDGDD